MSSFHQLSVERISKNLAREVCIKNHYSGKWNTAFGILNFGLFKNDVLLGVAVYGHPMNPKSWPKITTTNPSKCIELNRLWLDDELGKNSESWFLGKTFDLLRQEGVSLIQSFADGRLGVGTIYQATNFGFYGSHKTMFHSTDDGQTLHNNKFKDTSRLSSMVWRNVLMAEGKTKTFQVQTYRYLHALDKVAKKQILLESMPYPKQRLGMVELPNFLPPVNQIARAAAIAFCLGQTEDYKKLMDFLGTLVNDTTKALDLAFANPLIANLNKSTSSERLF